MNKQLEEAVEFITNAIMGIPQKVIFETIQITGDVEEPKLADRWERE